MKKRHIFLTGVAACGLTFGGVSLALAESVTATMFMANAQGQGAQVGTVTFTDRDGALEIRTALKGLPAGELGFHVHENGTCAPREENGSMTAAMAAGGHYDPDKTGTHRGPEGGGHKGDLPVLKVASDGSANLTMTVRGVQASDFKGRSLMIHEGGDNYTDTPENGGGGARLACGVIQ